jgi:hypothetical protein
MFAYFENDIAVHCSNIKPEGDFGEGFEECDDSFMGERLIRVDGIIRPMTEEELAAEIASLQE